MVSWHITLELLKTSHFFASSWSFAEKVFAFKTINDRLKRTNETTICFYGKKWCRFLLLSSWWLHLLIVSRLQFYEIENQMNRNRFWALILFFLLWFLLCHRFRSVSLMIRLIPFLTQLIQRNEKEAIKIDTEIRRRALHRSVATGKSCCFLVTLGCFRLNFHAIWSLRCCYQVMFERNSVDTMDHSLFQSSISQAEHLVHPNVCT